MSKEKIEYQREWRKTPMGRATMLLSAYIQSDKKRNRGKGDLTAKWIVDNIFTKSCAHCGETDWHKLGCNRLDNSKPHTMDNVEPCCKECNDRLFGYVKPPQPQKKIYQYTLDRQLVKIWESVNEAAKSLGFSSSHISSCANGYYGRKTHKGYRWSFEPL